MTTIESTAAVRLFDQLSDDELIGVAQHHVDKFNRAWKIVMANHYKSGRYIDAEDTMNREYGVLGLIEDYIRNNRPAKLHDQYQKLGY
jgi:hypothetical protein